MKKIITLLSVLTLLLLAFCPLYSNAASEGKIDINFRANSTNASKGDKITFNVVFKEFPKSQGEDVEFTASGFYVHYDADFFEDFKGATSSKKEEGLYYCINTYDPSLIRDSIAEGEEVVLYSFTLKVKQDTTLTSGEVYLSDDDLGETFSNGDVNVTFLNDRYSTTVSLASEQPDDPTPSTVSVTGISVSPTTKELTVGETFNIQATITPANATNKSVTWASSDTSVASVSSSGVVTAKAEGTTTITAKTNDGNYKATCAITVKKAEEENPTESDVKVTGVALDKTTGTVKVGGKLQLTATIAPSNAKNKNVTWSSSDTSIATVDSSGLVTGVKAGKAQITVKTVDGGKTAVATIAVSNEDVVINIEDNKPSSGGSSSKGTTDNTTAKDKIPQTGETFIVVAGLIALSSVAIVSYRKIKANKDI